MPPAARESASKRSARTVEVERESLREGLVFSMRSPSAADMPRAARAQARATPRPRRRPHHVSVRRVPNVRDEDTLATWSWDISAPRLGAHLDSPRGLRPSRRLATYVRCSLVAGFSPLLPALRACAAIP